MKPFKKLGMEKAVEFRSRLDGLWEHPGYLLLVEYFEGRASELRQGARPITDDSFATLNAHNRRLYQADAIEEVLQWVRNAVAQCDATIEGDAK